MPTSSIPNAHRGQPISAAEENRSVRAPLRALFQSGSQPSIISPAHGVLPRQQPIPAAPTQPQRMRIKAQQDETLTCRLWDGQNEGPSDVHVAKPWWLRRSSWDGQTRAGITYAYLAPGRRTASDGQTTQIESLTPSYELDDEILAVPAPVGGSGVGNTAWLDANLTARVWAQESA